MKIKINIVFFFILAVNSFHYAQENEIALTKKGFIPVWIAAGPFDQPLTGFGVPADKDVIGEKSIEPFWGKEEQDTIVKKEKVTWIPQSISNNGFLDFNKTLRWTLPADVPVKIWYAITGYAAAYVESPVNQKAMIKFGSNSFGKILINGEEVYSISNVRNARIDQDSIKITLKKGKNLILVKAGNSNANHDLAFFEMIKWEWGFYLRLLNENGKPLDNVKVYLPEKIKKPEIEFVSTFFFKKINGILNQRFDVNITSPYPENLKGKLEFHINNQDHSIDIDSIPFGVSRHEIFIPEIKNKLTAKAVLVINNEKIEKEVELLPEPHYELHMMMLAHTDIGYTNPQPVVKEIHANTLDEVVRMCNEYPDFKWTIESLWPLEQYEESRTPEQFQKVIELIKKGRIAASPLYSNPFTGWVGEEEMIRSLFKAEEYKAKYGLQFNAAVYNDVPGQAWIVPQILNNAGVDFLAEGINEFFNNYSLQKSLPKAFIWEGPDSSKVVTYLNEAYNEGKSYGLEGDRGNLAIQQRIWERINNLIARGYKYDIILLNSAFGDNSIVPEDQFKNMGKWNTEFEYPKFISSNVSMFGKEFVERYKDSLPVIKGDWTSNWDVFYQGEAERMKEHRWVQHNLLSAEKLAALTWLQDNKKLPLSNYINQAYRLMLNFSGHGSGLEYGYGSPADNLITQEYRKNYVHDAYLKTEEVLERAMYRIGKPEESFEGEGVIVFNTLSWKRNAPVEVQFTEENPQQYEVIDLVTKQKVESYRDGYKLFFIAKDLPSFGYKKYKLQPVNSKDESLNSGLLISDSSIANQFYKIEFSKSSNKIISIIDKKSGKELIDESNPLGFDQPLIEKFQDNQEFSMLNFSNQKIEIKNESPVRIILRIKRDDELFELTNYILWDDIDRVDIEQTVDTKKLKPTEKLEEYGLAFPFEIKNQNLKFEIVGGFLDPDKDKMPGTSKDGFSIRRTAALYNDINTLSWSSLDARVVRLREFEGHKFLISDVVNNFPKNWNRYEENEGKITFRYSFTNQAGNFNPAFTSKFGWELNTPPVNRRSWYRTDPVSQNFLNIDNQNLILLTMIPSVKENSFMLRIANVNPYKEEEGIISSEFFKNGNASFITYLGDELKKADVKNDSIKIQLKPNEIATLKISIREKETVKK